MSGAEFVAISEHSSVILTAGRPHATQQWNSYAIKKHNLLNGNSKARIIHW